MTTEQKKKVLIRIQQINGDLDKLREARMNIGTSGFQSMTLSSQGGSKSATKLSLGDITKLISELEKELMALRRMLQSNGGSQMGIETIATIYS